MDERLECLLALYHSNEYFLRMNPIDYEIHGEQEIIYRKMEECIPWEHCDEINLLVYGISRL
jgi:hypothetical protein